MRTTKRHRNSQTIVELPTGKIQQAQQAFVDLLSESTQSGFYGSASLTINVQDGHIQHVRVATEKTLR